MAAIPEDQLKVVVVLLRPVPALLDEVIERRAVDRHLALGHRIHRLSADLAAALPRPLVPQDALLIENAAHRVKAFGAHRVHTPVAKMNLLVPIPRDPFHVLAALVLDPLTRPIRFEVRDP